MLKSLDNVGRLTWATHIKQYFVFVWFWLCLGIPSSRDIDVFISTFKQRLTDCHKQIWNHQIQDSSRCLYYKEFKSLINRERYLQMNVPVKYRQTLSFAVLVTY